MTGPSRLAPTSTRNSHRLPKPLTAILMAAVLLGTGPGLFGAADSSSGESPSGVVLVAPLDPARDLKESDEAAALEELIAESLGARSGRATLTSRDLGPAVREELSIPGEAVPTLAVLTPSDAESALKAGGVSAVLYPSISEARGGIEIEIEWKNLRTGADGKVREVSARGRDLVDAAGKAASTAMSAAIGREKDAGGRPASSSRLPKLSESLSGSWPALAAWARGRAAWKTGQVPVAERELQAALEADGDFDQARVDLAWIRWGQGRMDEALELSGKAREGRKLSPQSRAMARIISGASLKETSGLHELSAELEKELPASWLPALAEALALNLEGKHPGAIPLLDAALNAHPNDPVLVHHAGMAALGFGDDFESVQRLGRAAALWPQHDRIRMDLAEAKVRARDLEGAREVLSAWAGEFDPSRPPTWGGEWSYEDPPPTVRATCVDLLTGSIEKPIEYLEDVNSRYKLAGAPVSVRAAVVQTIHELQMSLAWGDELQKQRWLDAARRSLTELEDLIGSGGDLRGARALSRLRARFLIREARIPEAEEIRSGILKQSEMPGYDPSLEAELEAAIAFKAADTDRFFEAAQRAVSSRGRLEDYYQLAQGYAVAAKWDEVETQFIVMEERISYWALNRREDAMLWSPLASGYVPFIYSLGAQSGVWRGDADTARARFSIFLGYFKSPDKIFRSFKREAVDRGATPAW